MDVRGTAPQYSGRIAGYSLAAFALAGFATLCALPSGCKKVERDAEKTPAFTLEVWSHSGREGERKVIEALTQKFEHKNRDVHIELTFIPDGSYNAQVQAAALADKLPDVLEFDGPYIYNYVWQGRLRPLDDLIPTSLRDNLIPSIIGQGTYQSKLYSVGMYDSGLGLYARARQLEQAHIRIPSGLGDAWTVEEFDRIMQKLAQSDPDNAVLDLKLNYRGEWYTYAFSPTLYSSGAKLIHHDHVPTARGYLNAPSAVHAMSWFQRWIHQEQWVDANVDDRAFIDGRVAFSWVGHWEYNRYHQKFGDDLLLLPLPDFGAGSKTGQGSWNWGVTQKCRHPQVAMQFLVFLMQDAHILEMTRHNTAVPATLTALRQSSQYQPGKPLQLFARQLTEGFTVPRPRTPAYPVITSVFQQAFDDIRHGGEIKSVLDHAALEIDQDIRDNQGYKPPNTSSQESP